jgi:hypothetical protein
MWDSLVTWLRAVASGSFASGCRYFSFFRPRPALSGGNPAFCPVVAEGWSLPQLCYYCYCCDNSRSIISVIRKLRVFLPAVLGIHSKEPEGHWRIIRSGLRLVWRVTFTCDCDCVVCLDRGRRGIRTVAGKSRGSLVEKCFHCFFSASYYIDICGLSGCTMFFHIHKRHDSRKIFWTWNMCFNLLYNFCLQQLSF